MPPEQSRADALAELAAEAARFVAEAVPAEAPVRRGTDPRRARAPQRRPPRAPARAVTAASATPDSGYVACAVAPERGNTRPIVPVDARLHLRIAPATVAALDAAVQALRARAPAGLRDLERATLVRIGAALVLADLEANGDRGAVGEAVRAALDPAQRHLAEPLPDLRRWLRRSPSETG